MVGLRGFGTSQYRVIRVGPGPAQACGLSRPCGVYTRSIVDNQQALWIYGLTKHTQIHRARPVGDWTGRAGGRGASAQGGEEGFALALAQAGYAALLGDAGLFQ